jgi:hypothetical protein
LPAGIPAKRIEDRAARAHFLYIAVERKRQVNVRDAVNALTRSSPQDYGANPQAGCLRVGEVRIMVLTPAAPKLVTVKLIP